ncbi:MAG: molybdate ABC transporter substrate-binding protein [Rhodospirillaceae bacterium]|nr:MAG: molybdate ABC transporter substrate-binding protein [Rhodospirillaceae bacterium]
MSRFVLFILMILMAAPALAVDSIRVFAAASTQPVFQDLTTKLKDLGINLIAVHAGSAILARQIEHGAGADVFITANVKWMDYLNDLNLIQQGTRRDVARNRLALISTQVLDLKAALPHLKDVLNGERLALADPDFVPAGLYAKQALMHSGQWEGLQNQLAPAKDVTGALMLVVRRATPLGIVYASDVGRSDQIKSFTLWPETSHSPIVYQAAAIKGAKSPALNAFLAVLSGPQGRAAFLKAGFYHD